MSTIVEVESAYRSCLEATGLVEYDDFMQVSGGKAVGWHRHRETVPLDLAVDGRTQRFFLKRVFRVPPKHAFWPLLRFHRGMSQPRREWRMLQELQEAGIPAMRRVAFGERRRLGMPASAFLLVEAVPMPYTLEDWLVPGFPKPPSADPRDRGQLLQGVGALIGRLHRAGFLWPDLHAKHVFASPPPSNRKRAPWEFCLIDVERMTRQPSAVPPERALREIATLRNNLRPMPFDEEDLHHFLTGYAEGYPASTFGTWEAVQTGGTRLARLADAGSCPRLPDQYRHPRCSGVVRSNGLLVDPTTTPLLERQGLRRFEDFFARAAGESLRKATLRGHRERIRLRLNDGQGTERTFYLKRYSRPPLGEQLRRVREASPFRGSAWREARFAMRLTRLGVPTIRLAAFGEKMVGPWEKASFMMSEEVPGESLEKLADRVHMGQAPAPPWEDRVEIIRQLAVIAALLHHHGLFHRDLYLSHVFWSRNADGGIVLWLIDLARMLQKPVCRRRWQVKDLAALHYSAPAGLVTRADRLRFLYYYGAALGRPGDPGRELMAAVARKSQRMAMHDMNRARRVAGQESPLGGRRQAT